jgi:hypothetical protein
MLQVERNESELLPYNRSGFMSRAGTSLLIAFLGLLTVFTVLRKALRFDKKILILALSVVILGLLVRLMSSQIFN